MKKNVNLKNEISKMLEETREKGQYIGHRQRPMTTYSMTCGNFQASYDILTGDNESRRLAEEYIRKRAAAVARGTVMTRKELERRSNNFQKALAFIGENRHLIPFLRFLDDYVRSHEGKSEYDAIREYKKNNQLPPELYHEGYGIYSFGPKMPHISIFLEQLLSKHSFTCM